LDPQVSTVDCVVDARYIILLSEKPLTLTVPVLQLSVEAHFVARGHLSRPRCQAGINWSARRGRFANAQAERTQPRLVLGTSHNTCHPNPKCDGAQFSFLKADEKMGRGHLESKLAFAACKLTRRRPLCEQSERAGRGRQRNKDVNRWILLACELGPQLAGVGLLLLPSPAK